MKSKLLLKYGLSLLLGIFILGFESFGQARTVTGTVYDEADNSGLPGVTVLVKGTTTATQTDVNGSYSINVPNDNAVLTFSFVGMHSQEVTVGSRSLLDIFLVTDLSTLDEVVVIGYGTARQKDLTGSIAIVNMNQLKAQPVASAVESLQGKATGVQIISDGAPGATPQIRIRGFSTINNNDPLFVIDGVPYEGKLSWLNQNDIENMQVLKDASAASIYGARANNGVVIITTRKGAKGPAKLSFDAYYGMQSPRRSAFPKMMNPQQYANFVFQQYQNNPAAGSVSTDPYGTGSSPVLPEYLLVGDKLGHNVTAADADMSKYNYTNNASTFYHIVRANQEGTNWFEEITENAPMQNYQLSLSGGGDNSTYVISGGVLDQQGIVKHSGFQRYNIRSNTTFSMLNHRLRLGQNLQYSHDISTGVGVNTNTAGDYINEGSPLGFAFRMSTIVPVYDEGQNFAGTRGSTLYLGNGRNPLAILYRAKDNNSKNNMFFGNVFGELDVLDGLTARTSFGLNYNNWASIGMSYPDPEFSEGSYSNNSLSESMGYGVNWTWTNTLDYKLNWDRQRFNVMLGTEAVDNRFRNMSAGRNDFFLLGNLDYYYLNTGTASFANASSGGTNSLFSLFGRAEYNLNDKYLVSGTLRRDGSSNFGPANKYGLFPAVSFAWRLSEEGFLQGSDLLDDLKLRVGYGVTGNQTIPGFQYLNRFAASLTHSAYPIDGGGVTTGVWQSAYANEDIKWEEVKSLNVGLDFSFLKGVLDGSLDWFNKNTDDMLYPMPLPAAAIGMGSAPFVNIGDMNNRGVELSLNYHHGVKVKRAFEFDAGFNFTHYKNKIVSLAPSVERQNYGTFRGMQTSILLPGQPFASFYGYKVVGIYQNEEDLNSSPTYPGARVGGLKYEDVSGPDGKKDGIIDADDRTIIGNPHPDFLYSVSLNGRYKNFDLGLFFNGSQGNDIFDATRHYTDMNAFDGTASARLLDAWSPSNSSSMIPSPYRDPSSYEFNSSSYYVQDGSYLRLKNLQLGYTFPSNKLFNNTFERLRVYVSGTNLLTFTKYDGLDPEVSQTSSTFSALGVDFGVYPVSRQFLVGLSLGF